ncbi:protein SERAC1 [Microdochium nivale]|nr:protein SERAC1 [Microdochium nivale]
MATSKNTWRVCGIDLHCTKVCLQQVLNDINGSPRFEIQSLATEYDGTDQTATVSFAEQAKPPHSLLPCRSHPGRGYQLKLDNDFLGFTTLFAPPEKDHQIDVIAVSGLGSHAFGSFKERGGEHMWLRDALPDDLFAGPGSRPMARVMIYGYKSPVAKSSSIQNIADIAGNLRHNLTALVSNKSPRPILVISHSLGGLIVKEAIIALAASKGDRDSEKLLRAIYGLVFFGVPHLGMVNESLLTMADNGPNMELIVSLGQENSGFLAGQVREFSGALKVLRGEVLCFYETQKSPTAEKKGGEWRMTGPKAVLVSKASATTCMLVADKSVHTCAIDRSHSEIVKYAQRDKAYNVMLPELQNLAKRAVRSAA